jgi:K+/H+ antiporter YhaU regulatory subunit KhtT
VVTIAEGMTARLATARSLDIPILSTSRIAEKGLMLIAALRRVSKDHDDLLPIAIMIQECLQHFGRVKKLAEELQRARQRSGVTDRAIRSVQAWLASPTKAGRDRIMNPQK